MQHLDPLQVVLAILGQPLLLEPLVHLLNLLGPLRRQLLGPLLLLLDPRLRIRLSRLSLLQLDPLHFIRPKSDSYELPSAIERVPRLVDARFERRCFLLLRLLILALLKVLLGERVGRLGGTRIGERL